MLLITLTIQSESGPPAIGQLTDDGNPNSISDFVSRM